MNNGDNSFLLNPVQDLLTSVAHWLPQLIGSLLILLVGYLVARAVEGLVKKLLHRARFDHYLQRGTAGSYIGRIVTSPAALVGSIIFWLIWLTALSIGVTVLGVPALTNFVNVVYGYLPNVLAAFLIFVVAGAVSTAVAGLATRLMGDTPTGKLVSTVVPVLVMLIATFMILNQLGIAREIVTITYAALMGSAALAMALAFGLGGREVASRLLEQAYDKGSAGVSQAQQDLKKGKARTSDAVAEVTQTHHKR